MTNKQTKHTVKQKSTQTRKHKQPNANRFYPSGFLLALPMKDVPPQATPWLLFLCCFLGCLFAYLFAYLFAFLGWFLFSARNIWLPLSSEALTWRPGLMTAGLPHHAARPSRSLRQHLGRMGRILWSAGNVPPRIAYLSIQRSCMLSIMGIRKMLGIQKLWQAFQEVWKTVMDGT